MREHLRSLVRENRTQGSARGAPGNGCLYLNLLLAESHCVSEASKARPLAAAEDHSASQAFRPFDLEGRKPIISHKRTLIQITPYHHGQKTGRASSIKGNL